MKRLFYVVALLVCVTATAQKHDSVNPHNTRFYKAEHGVAADYLELLENGTYRVIAREHVGLWVTEQGQWHQNGSVITLRPSNVMRGGEMVSAEGRSYDGAEIGYRGRTFIAFNAEDSAGIVIPVEETKQQLDIDPQSTPDHTFFKIGAKVYVRETKQAYPFRYLKPNK